MRIKTGTVASNSMDKTVSVRVNSRTPHPMYKKLVLSSKKFLAHTEKKLNVGDVVRIREIRPMSKNKYFEVFEVVSSAA